VIASRSAAEPSRGVPIADLLARFPAHKYQFLGKTVAEDDIVDTGTLSHAFPAGLSLHLPVSVGANNALIISWDKVTGPPDGGFPDVPIRIVEYAVIVDGFQVTVPATTTSVTVRIRGITPPRDTRVRGAGDRGQWEPVDHGGSFTKP
jgi:hypothetical protein